MNAHEIDFSAIRKRNENVIKLEGDKTYNEAERFAMSMNPESVCQAEQLISAFFAGYMQKGVDESERVIEEAKRKLGVA